MEEQKPEETKKKPRKPRSDKGKPKAIYRGRTLEDIKSDIIELVDEAVEMTIARAKVTWE